MDRKTCLIAALGMIMEAARMDGDHRRAQRCRRALRTVGAVA